MGVVNTDIAASDSYTENGQTVTYTTGIPHRNWDEFTSVTVTSIDGTGGGIAGFDITFRYSVDGGIVWSNWDIEANLPVLAANFSQYDDTLIEVKLTAKDISGGGSIDVSNVRLTGNENTTWPALDFTNTPFDEIAWDEQDWNEIWINLYHKLYYKGIMAEYVIRNEDERFDETDYKAMIRVIAYFFALLIRLGEIKLGEFYNYEANIIQLLTQRGVAVRDTETLADLQYILSHLYAEIRHRGTLQILAEKGGDAEVDGELLRFINYDGTSLYGWEWLPTQYSTICVDEIMITDVESWNPYVHIQLNQSPNNTADIVDLTGWTTGSGTPTANEDVGDGTKSIKLDPNESVYFTADVDPYLSYKLSWWAYNSLGDAEMQISIFTDIIGVNLIRTDQYVTALTPSNEGVFVGTASFGKKITTGRWTYFELFVYSIDFIQVDDDDQGNGIYFEGFGNGFVNCKFTDRSISQLSFWFYCLNGVDTDPLYIRDVKFTPLNLRNTVPVIDGKRIFDAHLPYLDNNLKKEALLEKLVDNLLPYATTANVVQSYQFEERYKTLMYNYTTLFYHRYAVSTPKGFPVSPANVRDQSPNGIGIFAAGPSSIKPAFGDEELIAFGDDSAGPDYLSISNNNAFPSRGQTRTIILGAENYGTTTEPLKLEGGTRDDFKWTWVYNGFDDNDHTFNIGSDTVTFEGLPNAVLYTLRIDANLNVRLRADGQDYEPTSGGVLTSLDTSDDHTDMRILETPYSGGGYSVVQALMMVFPFYLNAEDLYQIEFYWARYLRIGSIQQSDIQKSAY